MRLSKSRFLQKMVMGGATVCPKFTIKVLYFFTFHEFLNIRNPISINEKMQMLKMGTYYNNPIITQCVDKYEIHRYLEEKNIKINVAKLYKSYNRAEDIDWSELPDSFVLKCNHGCGYNILCKDKNKLDIESTKRTLNKWLKEDYWKRYCELQYKYVNRKIIAEEYLGDNISTYKFYCFNGEPKIMYLSSASETGELDYYLDFFDMQWNHMDYCLKEHANYPYKIEKPDMFDEMADVSRELSAPFPFVRVDLYCIQQTIYLSELTFLPTGGYMRLSKKSVLDEWGSWLSI